MLNGSYCNVKFNRFYSQSLKERSNVKHFCQVQTCIECCAWFSYLSLYYTKQSWNLIKLDLTEKNATTPLWLWNRSRSNLIQMSRAVWRLQPCKDLAYTMFKENATLRSCHQSTCSPSLLTNFRSQKQQTKHNLAHIVKQHVQDEPEQIRTQLYISTPCTAGTLKSDQGLEKSW